MPAALQMPASPPPEAQPIRFLLNGTPVHVDSLPITTTVLTYLRQHAGLIGTKEGCAEGDCGACTLITGEVRNGALILKPVNACIQLLPTMDGKALFTVEYLRQKDGRLHPVQEAMVACHASQCGFCTPGFVMSLWGLYLNHDSSTTTESEVRRAISGNLCRCTGYRPIVEAGKRMMSMPHVALNRHAIRAAVNEIRRDESLRYAHGAQQYFAPRTLAELTALRGTYPDATILAGGTDIGLWINKQLRNLDSIIYVGNVRELTIIEDHKAELVIGAAVSLTDAYAAMTCYYPEMSQMWERFASPPIRNAGTLGGNVANGSPIGDSMPALLALGARVEIARKGEIRQISLEDLYLGYQKKALAPDEVLATIRLPKPVAGLLFRTYKLSKRFDSDISAVCAAFAVRLDGEFIVDCRIAFGGMAAIPQRARVTEDALIGKRWDESAMAMAMSSLARDFKPLSDMRASAEYRAIAARNLLKRFYLETRPVAPLSPAGLSVFSAIGPHG